MTTEPQPLTASQIRALREGWRDAQARSVNQTAESETLALVLGFSPLAGAPAVPASGTAEELLSERNGSVMAIWRRAYSASRTE